MPDILHTPNREQVVTSNTWAFLHWAHTIHGIDLPDWAALQRWSLGDGPAFNAAIAAFARLPDVPLRLARQSGQQEALVLRRVGGQRVALSRDHLRGPHPTPQSTPVQAGFLNEGEGLGLPTDIAAPLTRFWPPATLVRPLADLLLHADLRADDRVLVANAAPWPWLVGLLEGTTVILAAAVTAATLMAVTADERATVLVAPAQTIAEAAFQRARHRPNLAPLRTIIATGGPMSPEGRTRIYTWIKSDLLLLARTGDTVWGNPLEPVYAHPAAMPGLFTLRASTPVPR